ncbi:unnamed protein product [Musa acuminata var. zebrina]
MMTEYRTHDGSKPKSSARTTAKWSKLLDESVLCKIFRKKSKGEEEEEAVSAL